MIEIEQSNKLNPTVENNSRLHELYIWFRTIYPERLLKIQRYEYLGLPLEETRYAVELEAYKKEQEIRSILGEAPLPNVITTTLL